MLVRLESSDFTAMVDIFLVSAMGRSETSDDDLENKQKS
jgi:hypothetical protein